MLISDALHGATAAPAQLVVHIFAILDQYKGVHADCNGASEFGGVRGCIAGT